MKIKLVTKSLGSKLLELMKLNTDDNNHPYKKLNYIQIDLDSNKFLITEGIIKYKSLEGEELCIYKLLRLLNDINYYDVNLIKDNTNILSIDNLSSDDYYKPVYVWDDNYEEGSIKVLISILPYKYNYRYIVSDGLSENIHDFASFSNAELVDEINIDEYRLSHGSRVIIK